ncbi:MAG: glycosyltransferase [Acidaminococcales bacterium]|jgi:UDP-D-galactose:(glucosyl)LPS alpha-1,6-D-galactosyltransferase|nr:glycosyltransferase [Acidaminococcales bacterium]
MKIAFVVARRMSGQGGMETIINRVLKNWGCPTDEITLVLSGKTGRDATWLAGTKHIKLWFQARLLGYPFLIAQLFFVLCRLRPDIAIAADSKATRYCVWYKKWFQKELKVACWLHMPFLQRIGERAGRIKGADFYLCVSEGMAKNFISYDIDPGKIHTIYNPLEPAGASLVPRSAKAVFVYLGRMVAGRAKRTDDFVRALSLLRGDWRAVAVGDGKDAGKIRELAKNLGIYDKIDWMGWQADPWAAVKEASCLVLTSDFEAFGLTLTEAMQRGVFCLSSDCAPGPLEIVQDGVNGQFYPIGDVEKLARLMQKIVDRPDALPAAAAIAQSVEKYSAETVIANMREICRGHLPKSAQSAQAQT